MDPVDVLQKVAKEVSTCTLCALQYSRKKAVPGEGPANARVLFIGEGPGFHENEQGRPFVGAAGKLLDELLTKMDMKRDEVFITNVVKCRPPNNRDPEPVEIEICTKTYLQRQLDAIQPKVIVTLGRYSMGLFLPDAKISRVHGQPFTVKGRLVVPMYHPAAALHQQSLRPALEKDFAGLPALIAKAKDTPARSDENSANGDKKDKDEPKQLKLF
jgi:DNA polymerase